MRSSCRPATANLVSLPCERERSRSHVGRAGHKGPVRSLRSSCQHVKANLVARPCRVSNTSAAHGTIATTARSRRWAKINFASSFTRWQTLSQRLTRLQCWSSVARWSPFLDRLGLANPLSSISSLVHASRRISSDVVHLDTPGCD